MTLKQAFTIWANMPENIALAAKSRSVVQHVLMKKYSDIDLEQITERFVRYSFKRCKEIQEVKTKAASILLHVLRWGAAHGHCQMPTFDISIAHCENKDKPKTEEDMEQTKQTRVSRPVAQIDPTTLEVIKVWPGITTAHNALKIQNIDRAIQRRGIAGGYFWCDEKDIDTFEPAKHGEKPTGRPKKTAEPTPAPKTATYPQAQVMNGDPAVVTAEPDDKPTPAPEPGNGEGMARSRLRNVPDQRLINELIARGWRGKIYKMLEIELDTNDVNRDYDK